MERYVKVKRDDGEIVIYDMKDYAEGFEYWSSIPDNCLYYGKCNDLTCLGKIIEKDDNLKELCDKFTYTYKYDSTFEHEMCYRDSNTGKWYDSVTDDILNEKEKSTIIGAIWTDKGLIYVAKMNKDEGFELL